MNLWRGLVIIWVTRRRLWGVKDPSKASPQEIRRLRQAQP